MRSAHLFYVIVLLFHNMAISFESSSEKNKMSEPILAPINKYCFKIKKREYVKSLPWLTSIRHDFDVNPASFGQNTVRVFYT